MVVNSSKNLNFLGTLTDGAAGQLALVQSGTATTVLQHAAGSTYSGGTTVNSGVLEVDNLSGSGTGTGPVTVNGGTLTGSGTIGGAVTLAGGALVPGSDSLLRHDHRRWPHLEQRHRRPPIGRARRQPK